jgi:hypothetical protein
LRSAESSSPSLIPVTTPHGLVAQSVALRRLHHLRLEDKALFDQHLRQVGVPYSDFSFANNICWSGDQQYFYQLFEGCFCLFALRDGALSMVLPPLGHEPQQAAAVHAGLRFMAESNPNQLGVIRYAHRDLLRTLRAHSPAGELPADYELVDERPDYIYRTADLAYLPGSGLKSRRNEINQFLRAHPTACLQPLEPAFHPAVLDLSERWVSCRTEDNDEYYAELAYEELRAIRYTLEHFSDLAVQGSCLVVDDRVEGFAIYERLPQGGAHVLFEKANRREKGAAPFLFREYCRLLLDCDEITTGDDLNLPSLQQNKESYRPVRLGEKVQLRLRLKP